VFTIFVLPGGLFRSLSVEEYAQRAWRQPFGCSRCLAIMSYSTIGKLVSSFVRSGMEPLFVSLLGIYYLVPSFIAEVRKRYPNENLDRLIQAEPILITSIS
jgi:hypothetical protein